MAERTLTLVLQRHNHTLKINKYLQLDNTQWNDNNYTWVNTACHPITGDVGLLLRGPSPFHPTIFIPELRTIDDDEKCYNPMMHLNTDTQFNHYCYQSKALTENNKYVIRFKKQAKRFSDTVGQEVDWIFPWSFNYQFGLPWATEYVIKFEDLGADKEFTMVSGVKITNWSDPGASDNTSAHCHGVSPYRSFRCTDFLYGSKTYSGLYIVSRDDKSSAMRTYHAPKGVTSYTRPDSGFSDMPFPHPGGASTHRRYRCDSSFIANWPNYVSESHGQFNIFTRRYDGVVFAMTHFYKDYPCFQAVAIFPFVLAKHVNVFDMCKHMAKIPGLTRCQTLDLSPFETVVQPTLASFTDLRNKPAMSIGLASYGAITKWLDRSSPKLYQGMVYQTTSNMDYKMYTYTRMPSDPAFDLDKGHAHLITAINQAQALFEYCKNATYPMVPPDWFTLANNPWYLLTDDGKTPATELGDPDPNEFEVTYEDGEGFQTLIGRRNFDDPDDNTMTVYAANLASFNNRYDYDPYLEVQATQMDQYRLFRRNAVFRHNPYPNGSVGSCAYAMINRLDADEIKEAYNTMYNARHHNGPIEDLAFRISDLFAPIDGLNMYYHCAATKYVDTYNSIANAIRYAVLASAGPLPESLPAIIDGQVCRFIPGFDGPGKREEPRIKKGVCRPVMLV
jgi:hypothetical protein